MPARQQPWNRPIRVNTITRSAATGMTVGLIEPEAERLLTADAVAPAGLFLVSRDAPSRVILAKGAGSFARIYVTETEGVSLAGDMLTPEVTEASAARSLPNGFAQAEKLVSAAVRRRES